MKFFSVLLLVASLFTATKTLAQNDSTFFNPSTYQWETLPKTPPSPNIDSIADAVLINALATWDHPEFFQTYGFKKNGQNSLIASDSNTVIQIDTFAETNTAEVSISYGDWAGYYWGYQFKSGRWYNLEANYSAAEIPQINEKINPFLQGLNTARMQSELAWLQGPGFGRIVDSLGKIPQRYSELADSVKSLRQEIQSIHELGYKTEGDYDPNFAYEFSQDTINDVLELLHNFATKMVDTTEAKKSSAAINYYVVMAKKIQGTISLGDQGYSVKVNATKLRDTTFIISWGEQIMLMPQPMEKFSKTTWMLQLFMEDYGIVLYPDKTVILFEGTDQIGSYEKGNWITEGRYTIGDLQKTFLKSQLLLPR